MNYPIFQVDAFAEKVFGGNPAAVCPLTEWLPTDLMQKLAFENNLSETAFFIKKDGEYHIRWFTPEVEVDLCGHATLASAYIIFNFYEEDALSLNLNSMSGQLVVERKGDKIELNFPARMPQQVETPEGISDCFNKKPVEVLKSRDYFLLYESEEDVRSLVPDYAVMNRLNALGVIVTAPGTDVDFVSRFFVPNSVIGEDPVTGSAHSTLIPYWSKHLNKSDLTARQLSARGGYLWCKYLGDRVTMAGNAVLYMKGEYYI